jgi:hypothetical protein
MVGGQLVVELKAVPQILFYKRASSASSSRLARPGPTVETTRAEAPPGKRGAFRLDLGPDCRGGCAGRSRSRSSRIMSGRSTRPGNPDEAKGGRRDAVLALPRLGGSTPRARAPAPGPKRPSWPPPRHGGSSTSPSNGARTSVVLWGYLSPRGILTSAVAARRRRWRSPACAWASRASRDPTSG